MTPWVPLACSPLAGMHSGSRLPMVCGLPSLLSRTYLASMFPSPFAHCLDRGPPSQRCAKPRLHRSKHGYIFDHLKSIHPVTSSPQSVHTKAELLPARETHSFHHDHVGRELAPNSSCPVRHSRKPATPLKPGIRRGSPASNTLPPSSIRQTRKPQGSILFSTQPTWIDYQQASVISAPNRLSIKSRVH